MPEQAQEQAATEAQQADVAAPNTDGSATETAQPQTEKQPEQEAVAEAPKAPETADGYAPEIDGFDFEAFKQNEANANFIAEAHKAGFTNEQLTVALKAHSEANALAIEQLQSEWGDDYNKNVMAAKAAIEAVGMDIADIDTPIGILKFAAKIGAKLSEDMPPQNTQQTNSQSIQELMASEAYMNERHPDHKRVYAQVSSYYAKMNPGD